MSGKCEYLLIVMFYVNTARILSSDVGRLPFVTLPREGF